MKPDRTKIIYKPESERRKWEKEPQLLPTRRKGVASQREAPGEKRGIAPKNSRGKEPRQPFYRKNAGTGSHHGPSMSKLVIKKNETGKVRGDARETWKKRGPVRISQLVKQLKKALRPRKSQGGRDLDNGCGFLEGAKKNGDDG